MTNDPFLRPGPASRSLEQASPYPPPPTNPQEEPSAGAVREYDPRWPIQFATERALLRELLQPWLTTDIEHVGSTAVPGMPAKPCIDMLAGVADLEQARAAGEVLRHHGYHYRVHRPEAHLFEKPGVGDWRRHTHHLHLTEPGSDLWNERVTFRDALRTNAALTQEYSLWKHAHAAHDADAVDPYNETKWPFVSRVLAQQGVLLQADRLRLASLKKRTDHLTRGQRLGAPSVYDQTERPASLHPTPLPLLPAASGADSCRQRLLLGGNQPAGNQGSGRCSNRGSA